MAAVVTGLAFASERLLHGDDGRGLSLGPVVTETGVLERGVDGRFLLATRASLAGSAAPARVARFCLLPDPRMAALSPRGGLWSVELRLRRRLGWDLCGDQIAPAFAWEVLDVRAVSPISCALRVYVEQGMSCRAARAPTQSAPEVLDDNGDIYPAEARREGLEGRSVVTLTVGPDGALGACRVAESSGHAVLDRRACELFVADPRFARPLGPADVERGTVQRAITWRLQN